MPLSRPALRAFFQTELGIDMTRVADDTPLFSGGLIDSNMILSVISYVEREIGARLGVSDLDIQNFDTVAMILALAESRAKPG